MDRKLPPPKPPRQKVVPAFTPTMVHLPLFGHVLKDGSPDSPPIQSTFVSHLPKNPCNKRQLHGKSLTILDEKGDDNEKEDNTFATSAPTSECVVPTSFISGRHRPRSQSADHLPVGCLSILRETAAISSHRQRSNLWDFHRLPDDEKDNVMEEKSLNDVTSLSDSETDEHSVKRQNKHSLPSIYFRLKTNHICFLLL